MAIGGQSGCCAWRPPTRSTRGAIGEAARGASSPRRGGGGEAGVALGLLRPAETGRPASARSGQLADDPDDLALDLDLRRVDRLHLGVGRLETDAILLAVEALQRHAVVLEE